VAAEKEEVNPDESAGSNEDPNKKAV